MAIHTAIILYSGNMDKIDSSFRKLAEFMGVSCKSIDTEGLSLQTVADRIVDKQVCVITSGKTLTKMLEMCEYNYHMFKDLIISNIKTLFVYGLYPDKIMNSVVSSLSDGAVQSISSFRTCNLRYSITDKSKVICDTFSGMTIEPINTNTDFGLDFDNKSRKINSLVNISNKSLFMMLKQGQSVLYLLSCTNIIDVDDYVSSQLDVKDYFSGLVPVLMFLKYTFKEYVWQTINRWACFIIDDPLLRPKYGFLEYGKLLHIMDTYGFCTSIAFIPWNYNRSNKAILNTFLLRPDRYSISIHGCDHTRNEFASNDLNEINARVSLSKYRMKKHFEKSGVPFDNVMIFPQGVFSVGAMMVLKSNNFLASVNTEVVDSNLSKIRISDLISPAVMSYGDFPLFTRRYIRDGIANFALDLFLGKPCLIVEHHDIFKKGYEALGEFVGSINNLDENLSWGGLGHIISNTYQQKKIRTSNTIAVRIFSNMCIIENPGRNTIQYDIVKSESANVPIKAVQINGNNSYYCINNGILQISLELKPQEKKIIRIIYDNPYGYDASFATLGYSTRTAMRRYLSEVRDNIISKNKLAQKMFDRLKRLAYSANPVKH